MTALVFVDTNVLLYASDENEPSKQPRAQAWLERLWRERLGRTSVQVLSEFYVNLKRLGGTRMTVNECWERMARYFAWKPLPANETLMQRGRQIEQRYRLSWWDSTVVGAVQLQGCTLLLTEDLQDGAVFGNVTVRSPFTLDVREPAAAYDVALAAAPRHRPRGRPAKRPSIAAGYVE
jgi:predicted nucleic acid-binding protein